MELDRFKKQLPHKIHGDHGGANVGAAERILSGAIGLVALRAAMKGGWLRRLLLLAPAAAALKRAATGKCELYQAAGISSAQEQKRMGEDSAPQWTKPPTTSMYEGRRMPNY